MLPAEPNVGNICNASVQLGRHQSTNYSTRLQNILGSCNTIDPPGFSLLVAVDEAPLEVMATKITGADRGKEDRAGWSSVFGPYGL